jgi:predicted ATPase
MSSSIKMVNESATGNVPASTTRMLGRSQELLQIMGLLTDDATRLLALLGPGGVGKTRLALAVAEEIEHSGAATVHFVAAADLLSDQALLIEIAAEIGVFDSAGKSLDQSVAQAKRRCVAGAGQS